MFTLQISDISIYMNNVFLKDNYCELVEELLKSVSDNVKCNQPNRVSNQGDASYCQNVIDLFRSITFACTYGQVYFSEIILHMY